MNRKIVIPGWVGAIMGLCVGTALLIAVPLDSDESGIVESTEETTFSEVCLYQTDTLITLQPPQVVEESGELVEDVHNSVNDEPVHAQTEDETKEDLECPIFTEEELEILAIIIYQEAGGDACSDDTRRKVGSVFLNRVKSSTFPNTFLEVATQKRQYGLLYKTGIKWPSRAANSGEAHAVKRAYSIAEELLIGGSQLPDNVVWQAEFPQGTGVYAYQDGIYFCY